MLHSIRPKIFASRSHVRSAVSTRHGGVSPAPLGLNLSYKVGDDPENVRQNRSRFLGSLGFAEERTAFTDQCHSAIVKEAHGPGVYSSCDGLVTGEMGVGLAISIADCVPVLLFDPSTNVIAALHAGWRGSRGHIVSSGCQFLQNVYGAEMKDVLAYVGPAAGPCCYEVGKDVSDHFREAVRRQADGKLTLDLKEENRLQLVEAGIPAVNIEIDPRCTICSPELLHSYRRDRDSSGRMLAFIGLTEED